MINLEDSDAKDIVKLVYHHTYDKSLHIPYSQQKNRSIVMYVSCMQLYFQYMHNYAHALEKHKGQIVCL